MGKRKNFDVTDLEEKRLQMMSKKTGLSESELLRSAIDEYLEKFEKKSKRR
jgi:predicted DNA-binding protein